MRILGLDTGTKTGWSFILGGEAVESGVQDFTKGRGESNGLMFLRFRTWLNNLCGHCNPDLIAYERAHFRGGAATEIGVGLQTRAQEVAAKRNIESAPVHTGTLKKWATGVGNASKMDMVLAAQKISGRPIYSDDEADAILVGLWANDVYGGGKV